MSDTSGIQGREPFPGAPGSHPLPQRFGGRGDVAPAARRRRLSRGVLAVGLAVIVSGGAFGGVQLGSNLRFDDAAAAYDTALDEAVDARDSLETAGSGLEATRASADALVVGNTGMLLDGVPLAHLDAAIAAAEDASAAADGILATEVESEPEKPGWFWELFAAAAHLDEARADAADFEEAAEAQAPLVTASEDALTTAGITVISAASTAAGPFEGAHLSARNADVIALRAAAASSADPVALDDEAVAGFAQLQAAAAKVVESENAELAEKDGPLRTNRLEIEAFARSLAPGVLLEFDWAPTVNGYGAEGSMGGYTTWWWDEPDRAVILLSNSVAEQWPAERSRALVAHEVGHAISVKCEEMYDSSTQDSIEKWATAWAIGMGFIDDANGVWAYGYPPQTYIDAAAGCR